LGLLTGCVHYQPRPISAENTATALTARSLHDEGLHHYLTENLGRELSPWPPETWNFESLSWVAFYYQPSLEVARAQWAVARSAVKTAAERPNPTLSLIPGYDTSAPAGTSPWFPAVNLDFLVETARKRGYRVAIEQLGAEAARLDVLASAWQVRSELRRALVDVAATVRQHDLLGRQSALQQELVMLAEQRLKAGAVSSIEVSATRVALVKAEAAAADAARQVPQARNRVAQALGVPLSALESVRLDDLLALTPPALGGEELGAARRQSLHLRADVLGALARYEASQAALQLEVARQYPDFHLGPGYQYDLGENKWSLALTLELPLFNRNQGPLAEAEARRREAAAQFVATQARAIGEIDGAASAEAAAADQVAHLRRFVEEVRQQSARVEARVSAGDADRIELLNARIELGSAETALLDADVAAAGAAGRLEEALQVPFPHLTAVANAPAAAGPTTFP
jgi:outer membrane protein TolC